MKKRRLIILFACLFVTMIGFGITLPVLPFYTERLALAEGVSREGVAIHVGGLTSVYVLMQFFSAPLWGRWSDRAGRRPLILVGIGGYAIAQLLFGLATSLKMLYGARILGGILSSATLPAATAYVADLTTEEERSRGMAGLGGAASLGVVVGPALGGVLSRRDLHFTARYGHFQIDGFSLPFFTAAALAVFTLVIAERWLSESLHNQTAPSATNEGVTGGWRELEVKLRPLPGLALAGQFGLAIFETTFALYALEVLNYGPSQVGAAFMVCGLVMAVFQLGVVSYLTRLISEIQQVAAGFILMGSGLVLLLLVRPTGLVLSAVGLLALGMSFISPNLLALISKRGGERTGTSLGIQNAANSLGQAGGPLLGGVLFAWQAQAPYLLAGIMLFGVGLMTGWMAWAKRSG